MTLSSPNYIDKFSKIVQRPNYLNPYDRGWQSHIGKTLILIGFLINSLTLAILFAFLNLEWENAKNVADWKNNCNEMLQIYDQVIESNIFYFIVVSVLLCTLIVFLQIKRFELHKHVYFILSLVSILSFFFSTFLIINYIFITSYTFDECDQSDRIKVLKLRLLMQEVGASITNALYMGIGLVLISVQNELQIQLPTTKIYSISPPEFDVTITPPPKYYK